MKFERWYTISEIRDMHDAEETNTGVTPKCEWVGLTEQERNDLEDYCEMMIGNAAFNAIEAKLKEKNTP